MDSENEKAEPLSYPAEMGYLPPRFVEKAKKELFENPQLQSHQIEEMRNLLRNEQAIKEEWFSDDDLILYLRAGKHNVQKAFGVLKRTVAVIKKHAHLLQEYDPVAMGMFLDKASFKYLPRRDKEGQLIFVAKLGKWDPILFPVEKALVNMTLITWHAARDPMTQVNGALVIIDFDVPILKYVRYLTPSHIYSAYQLLTECVPMRKKGAHMVNPNMLTRLFMPIYKAFLSQKLRSRVFCHGHPSDVLDYIQADAVPTEYGGNLTAEEQWNSKSVNIAMPDFIKNILTYMESEHSKTRLRINI